eukprot:13395675-Heterocapsa_arctica.AAC.1
MDLGRGQRFQTVADLQSGERAGGFSKDMEFSRVPGSFHTRGVIIGKEGVLIREVFNLTPVSAFQGPKESHDGA